MSARIAAVHAPRPTPRAEVVQLALLGTGTVGTAVLHRLAALQDEGHGAGLVARPVIVRGHRPSAERAAKRELPA